MPWPSVTDFTGAIQNPAVCFDDPELAQGQAGLHPQRGTPLVYAGNFAAVYPLTCGADKYAVRCFTREVKDQQERYGHLDNYLRGVRPDSFVSFQYRERGIKIRGEWYPIVTMTWVEGRRLDRFVEDNLTRPDRILDVCARWRGANGSLRGLKIAHNDLQHGNIMVQSDGAIRLVDYDGIFLPRFEGQPSPEGGHPQYQHPMRKMADYGEYVDNFPSLVLYLSLLALSADPGLWQRFYTQENLLLTKADYADPANSDCFRALKGSADATVRYLAEYLEECCSKPIDQVLQLEDILSGAPASSHTAAPASVAPISVPPAPAPVAAPPQPSGAGSDYRNLLQMGQVVTPSPIITSAPPSALPSVVCPQCNQSNPDELIYCDEEECAAVLHTGRRFCAYCGFVSPVNAKYCPDCGKDAA